jgi:NhaC family Na+:H+ antiporter
VEQMTFQSAYKGVMDAITGKVVIPDNDTALFYWMQKTRHNLVDYLRYGFGGIMDAIGALSRISNALLKLAHTTFGLFASSWKLFSLKHHCFRSIFSHCSTGKMFAKRMKIKVLL